jgi:hypothetical protein
MQASSQRFMFGLLSVFDDEVGIPGDVMDRDL